MDVSRWYSIICARAGPDVQLEVVLHSVLWGIAGTTGGGPAAEIIMVIYGCIAVCMCQQTAVAVVVVVEVVVAGACNKGG